MKFLFLGSGISDHEVLPRAMRALGARGLLAPRDFNSDNRRDSLVRLRGVRSKNKEVRFAIRGRASAARRAPGRGDGHGRTFRESPRIISDKTN
ncbi:hypothetical protein EVAR_19367_1 [Eumeta japonica]|uniref:Uncharacterized protein n=1 Tax=Eumeta variegata TaxID=151549 RepID=A0A4C1TRE8_EUMVA|nr:hypothetical protein EVAR_19367_1 [Eumeta japonica]